jgi:pimeloyl-ACP methyl ester carboxylesterase
MSPDGSTSTNNSRRIENVDDHRFWLNRTEYPFAFREFDSGEGWMNYIDEGQGRPIVFVHGNMTWSFMFRRTIEALQDTHRCVVIDHLGFGLSDKPTDANYSPAGHARRFAKFMAQLNLKDVTLVVHDAGAPIALDWAADNPDAIREIVIFNSHLWSLNENQMAQKLAKMILSPANRFYYRYIQSAPGFVLPALFADRYAISRSIERQYLKPFSLYSERTGVYKMVESWQSSGPWYESVREKSKSLSLKRILLLWGMKDPMFGPDALARMREIFPESQTIEFQESGRFLPEEQAERVTGEIKWFLMNSGNQSYSLVEQLGDY